MNNDNLNQAAMDYITSLNNILSGNINKKVTKITVKQDYQPTEYLSVQFTDEDGEVVDCNHGGAEYVNVDSGRPTYSNGALDWYEDINEALACDKCDYIKILEPSEPDYDEE